MFVPTEVVVSWCALWCRSPTGRFWGWVPPERLCGLLRLLAAPGVPEMVGHLHLQAMDDSLKGKNREGLLDSPDSGLPPSPSPPFCSLSPGLLESRSGSCSTPVESHHGSDKKESRDGKLVSASLSLCPCPSVPVPPQLSSLFLRASQLWCQGVRELIRLGVGFPDWGPGTPGGPCQDSRGSQSEGRTFSNPAADSSSQSLTRLTREAPPHWSGWFGARVAGAK